MPQVRIQDLSKILRAAKKVHKGRRMIMESNIRMGKDTPRTRRNKLKLARAGAKMSVQGTMELNRIKRLTK